MSDFRKYQNFARCRSFLFPNSNGFAEIISDDFPGPLHAAVFWRFSGCRHLFPRARVRVNVATRSVTIQ
jgi:hypothetical protein